MDKVRLDQLIDLISNIRIGDAEARAKDVLGRVYEYFLSQGKDRGVDCGVIDDWVVDIDALGLIGS